ncbi:toll-like receptor 4 [Mya arenaria]|uniref:toll-like receptor 4 n=1 Tax=Mya arenaria TaxID=6604 RepID=UPI0022E77CDC|nr:toll-like receptor 4 [Mya arenaria]
MSDSFFITLICSLLAIGQCQYMDSPNMSCGIPKNSRKSRCGTNNACWCFYSSILAVDCSGSNLDKVPQGLPAKIAIFILRNNSINTTENISYDHFTILTCLDLSSNKIGTIQDGSFNNSLYLRTLLLSENNITYFGKGVLSTHNKLETLDVRRNSRKSKTSYPCKIQQETQKATNLQGLLIDGSPCTANLSFSHLTSLILGGDETLCNINTIRSSMFTQLPSLRKLQLRNCQIRRVENGSFSNLKNLRFLDLSSNPYLTFSAMPNFTFGLIPTNISFLNISNLHTTFGNCTILTASDLEYLSKTNIEHLYLDSNRISNMEIEAVRFIPRHLKTLSLVDNKLALGHYVVQIFVNIVTKELFSDLETIWFSHRHKNHQFRFFYLVNDVFQRKLSHNANITKRAMLYSDPKRSSRTRFLRSITDNNARKLNNESFKDDLLDDFTSSIDFHIRNGLCDNCRNVSNSIEKIPLPAAVRHVDAKDLKVRTTIRSYCFCQPNNIQIVNLSTNVLHTWNGPILGLDKLKELHLDDNSCSEIALNAFHNMANLEILNIAQNYLGYVFTNDNEGILLSRLEKLKYLDLSSNKIKQLPTGVFIGLVGLEQLLLRDNNLKSVSFEANHMQHLKFIDLTLNMIKTISPDTLTLFTKVIVANNFSIALKNNSFSCTCKYVYLVKWFSETRVTAFQELNQYKCTFDNGSKGYLSNAHQIYKTLNKQCANYLPLIVSTSISLFIILVIITCSFVYRFRWDLRYIYYSAKYRFKGYASVNHESGDYEFDAFVSYAEKDAVFVHQRLAPELESNRGLRLLVHDRDFLAGNMVNENIIHAITSSRKTLIIMSPNFLASSWCVYEMNMARMETIKTGRDVLCVVLKENVQTNGLPLEILDVFRERTYLELPVEGGDLEDQFWDRLADAVCQ